MQQWIVMMIVSQKLKSIEAAQKEKGSLERL